MSDKLTAAEVLIKWIGYGELPINPNDRVIRAMEEYAAQQAEGYKYTNEILAVGHNRLNRENEKMIELLEECRLQLEYIDRRFPTGTTPNILSRVQEFLTSIETTNG